MKIDIDEETRLRKNRTISEKRIATYHRRREQEIRYVEIKIQMNRLNAREREYLRMIFTEAKWFWNSIVRWTEEGKEASEFDASIKTAVHFDADWEPVISEFRYLPAAVKQQLKNQFLYNLKTLATQKEHERKTGRIGYVSLWTQSNSDSTEGLTV